MGKDRQREERWVRILDDGREERLGLNWERTERKRWGWG